MNRAYSVLDVKSVDEERRMVEGWATTPKLDRQGDIVDWEGLTFGSDVKLLLYHDSTLPVGNVRFGTPTKKGLPFTAFIPKVIEPGRVKDRVDEAWHSVKYDLIAAVSIGFRILDDAIERIETGYKFLKTEILELSLVPVPANDQAVITSFKSMDSATIERIKQIQAEVAAQGGVPFADSDTEIQTEAPAATGKTARVVRLNDRARDRAKPFVIRKIRPG